MRQAPTQIGLPLPALPASMILSLAATGRPDVSQIFSFCDKWAREKCFGAYGARKVWGVGAEGLLVIRHPNRASSHPAS
jgi:hypothetical protein